ncbi:MAG: nucleotidyltransferase family protein [Clostridium sp.]|nr:nucleotidyltransferase family protein [Clostridium sp.]
MKIIGFITEYNPFHNGHLYHMERSKELTGADFCVALMSGSFVQRGEPAVFDKYVRTEMALRAGADLVLELPVAFSTASAMEFASFGVALFTALKSVDCLCFGSERGSLAPLVRAAGLMERETPEFKELLLKGLKEGMSYPKSRSRALCRLTPSLSDDEEPNLLLSPNNLLGIEYIRAGIRQNSPLGFVTFRREGSHYHEDRLPDASCFPSASALRRALKSGDTDALAPFIPAACLDAVREEIPLFADDFSSLLNYRILSGSLNDIADLAPELEMRLRKNAFFPASFTERIRRLKSRSFTYSRISRALLHLALDLRAGDVQAFKQAGYALYARILGFRRQSAPLLRHLKETSAIPLLTRPAAAKKILPPLAMAMLEQEIRAAHLWQTIRHEKGGEYKNEYQQGVVIR